VQGESAPAGERQLRSTPDWGEGAINGDHLWVPTSASGDLCYVGDSECQVRIANYDSVRKETYFPGGCSGNFLFMGLIFNWHPPRCENS
jgi:hypothetical protein